MRSENQLKTCTMHSLNNQNLDESTIYPEVNSSHVVRVMNHAAL